MTQEESVLLAASTDKGTALLNDLVPEGQFGCVKRCRSGSEARRALLSATYTLIVINTPLCDENGLDLARQAVEQSIAGVLLLVKADAFDMVSVHMEESGVLVISKPVARPLFEQAVRFALSSRRRMLHLQQENDRLSRKLLEQRLIDRAKCVLIQTLGMSEEEAHRYLEKQAMDKRQTRLAIAKAVLATYEL